MNTIVEIYNLKDDDENIIEMLTYLKKHPVRLSNKRINSVGKGRTTVYGWGGRRSLGIGEFKNNTIHPDMYQGLLKLAEDYLPDSMKPFDKLAIQVNQNLECKPHFDSTNIGISYLFVIGDFTGGELVISNICSVEPNNKLIGFNGSKFEHYVKPFTGNRYSFVFFKSGAKVAKVGVKQNHHKFD